MVYIIFLIFLIFAFIKAISYGVYEIKTNNNTFAGIATFILALLGLVFPNIVIWMNGTY